MDINAKITIPLEQYEDLIRAQHRLELLICARDNFCFTFEENGARLFDAIASGGC